jgi:hypothetical protein
VNVTQGAQFVPWLEMANAALALHCGSKAQGLLTLGCARSLICHRPRSRLPSVFTLMADGLHEDSARATATAVTSVDVGLKPAARPTCAQRSAPVAAAVCMSVDCPAVVARVVVRATAACGGVSTINAAQDGQGHGTWGVTFIWHHPLWMAEPLNGIPPEAPGRLDRTVGDAGGRRPPAGTADPSHRAFRWDVGLSI